MERAAVVAVIAVLLVVVAGVAYYAGLSTGSGQVIPTTVTQTTTATETTTVSKATTVTATTTVIKTETMVKERIVDALGNIVELSKVPERVVSLSPSITEIVCAVSGCDVLVGVDQYSNYPPELEALKKEGKIQVIGGYWNPDVEKILSLRPDIVFANAGVPNHVKVAEQLESHGITVVFLKGDKSRDFNDIASDIMIVATLLGNETAGKNIVKAIQEKIEKVKEKLVETNATKVPALILFGSPKSGIWAAGGGTFIDYVIRTAGGVNVASKYHGWPMLSPEELLVLNPTTTIIISDAQPSTVISEWLNTTLAETDSAKNGTICVIGGPASDAVLRPGPRVGDAVEILASILHPDLFDKPQYYADNIYCVSQEARG